MTINYLDMATVRAARETDMPASRTRTGYGSKLPTQWQVQLEDKRWRRVYLVIWSNSGTLYVLVAGKPQYIAGHEVHRIVGLAGN
jgi:hypothetical protein